MSVLSIAGDTISCAPVTQLVKIMRMPKTARAKDPGSSLRVGNGDQDEQEVNDHQEGANHKDDEDKQFHIGADNQNEGDDICTIILGNSGPTTESPPPTIKDAMLEMFISLMFSRMVMRKLVEEQGVDSPETSISTICDG